MKTTRTNVSDSHQFEFLLNRELYRRSLFNYVYSDERTKYVRRAYRSLGDLFV